MSILNKIYDWFDSTMCPIIAFWCLVAAIVAIIGLIVWLCVSNGHKRHHIKQQEQQIVLLSAERKEVEDVKDSSEQNAKLIKENKELNDKITQLVTEKGEILKEKQTLITEKQADTAIIEDLKKRVAAASSETARLNTELESSKATVNALTSQVTTTSELDDMRKKATELVEDLQKVMDKFKTVYRDDLSKYNRETLFKYAKALEIPGYSTKSNKELVEAIQMSYDDAVNGNLI